MKKILYIAAVIAAAMLYFVFRPLFYQTNYFSELGIGESHLYSDIVRKKGKPLSVRQDDGGDWIVHYDGMDIRYGSELQTGALECVTVTGNQYSFGTEKIGVGSSRKKVYNVYRHIRKINDLPKNEFGVIEGSTWVWFKFDENNNVSQIDITSGF